MLREWVWFILEYWQQILVTMLLVFVGVQFIRRELQQVREEKEQAQRWARVMDEWEREDYRQ